VSGAQTGGRFALVQTSERRGQEPPRHVHEHEDELLYVLEGQLEVVVGEARQAVAAGAAVLLPRGIEHSFVLRSNEAALLLLLLPAGLEDYFHAASQWAIEAELPTGEEISPQVERLITLAARYGVTITGPP